MNLHTRFSCLGTTKTRLCWHISSCIFFHTPLFAPCKPMLDNAIFTFLQRLYLWLHVLSKAYIFIGQFLCNLDKEIQGVKMNSC